jgi:hypothetical protein
MARVQISGNFQRNTFWCGNPDFTIFPNIPVTLILKSIGSIPLCLVNNHKGVTKPSNTTIATTAIVVLDGLVTPL